MSKRIAMIIAFERFRDLCCAQLAGRELPWKRARLYLGASSGRSA